MAEALSARHGLVTITREEGGIHLNMACPNCLQSEGASELRKRHLAINADKVCSLGSWAPENLEEALTPRQRDGAAMCMKCSAKFKVSNLLDYVPLSMRGFQQASEVKFSDNRQWLVEARGPAGQTILIPGGPGVDGHRQGLIPVHMLPRDHAAVQYLHSRGFFDLEGLWNQQQVSYCEEEWPEDREAKRYYHKLPLGFANSPQGKLIWFAMVHGVQVAWQQRVLETVWDHSDGFTYKAYWHGRQRQWVTVEYRKTGSVEKFKPLPGVESERMEWDMHKYQTAKGTERNNVLFGFDAAVQWNRLHRPDQLPVVLGVEGPADAGKLGPPAVARIGKFWSDAQIALLAGSFARMFNIPDNDPAGLRDAREDTDRLCHKIETELWVPPFNLNGRQIKDPGDFTMQEAAEIKAQLLSQV